MAIESDEDDDDDDDGDSSRVMLACICVGKFSREKNNNRNYVGGILRSARTGCRYSYIETKPPFENG